MNKIKYLIVIIVLFSPSILCQDVIEYKSNISVNIGYLRNFIIDDYISPNEYFGSTTSYGFSWGDKNNKRIIQINVSLDKINSLKNNLSKATVSNFVFNYNHTFFITKNKIFFKPLYFYLGPGLSIFFYDRSQTNIPLNSQIGFGSINLNSLANFILTNKISISTRLLLSIISFGGNSKDNSSNNHNSTFKILSLFSMPYIEFDIRCKYDLSNLFFVSGIYNFSYIRKLNYFRVMGDQISLQLGISF